MNYKDSIIKQLLQWFDGIGNQGYLWIKGETINRKFLEFSNMFYLNILINICILIFAPNMFFLAFMSFFLKNSSMTRCVHAISLFDVSIYSFNILNCISHILTKRPWAEFVLCSILKVLVWGLTKNLCYSEIMTIIIIILLEKDEKIFRLMIAYMKEKQT